MSFGVVCSHRDTVRNTAEEALFIIPFAETLLALEGGKCRKVDARVDDEEEPEVEQPHARRRQKISELWNMATDIARPCSMSGAPEPRGHRPEWARCENKDHGRANESARPPPPSTTQGQVKGKPRRVVCAWA